MAARPESADRMTWLAQTPPPLATAVGRLAARRQRALTKPPGALGVLERSVVRLAAQQGDVLPRADRVCMVVFAGDHGIVAEGVSAFPPAVTVQMLGNFSSGGAAINVLARHLQAELEVVNVGTASDPGPLANVVNARIAAGTRNFIDQPAMDEGQLADALGVGRQAVSRAVARGAQLLVLGEMGIGNTTSATALGCALLSLPAEALAGSGTGLSADGVARKAAVVDRALAHHRLGPGEPLQALCCVGGLEIAALTGALIAATQCGLPCLVDGFVVTAAALTASRIQPRVTDWLHYGHLSAERGHRRLLNALGARPLLSLGMRLGEASGAAMAVPLLRAACALHAGMATFDDAGVSDGDSRDPGRTD